MGVRRRRPTVTEQIRHTEICIEASKREAAERAAEQAEETRGMPDDWECCHSAHYPPSWIENRDRLSLIDPVVLALASLRRFANQAPLSDAQREYYHQVARTAYESYGRTLPAAVAYIEKHNEIYEREVDERIAASRAARGADPK